jgi:hypothetical protein
MKTRIVVLITLSILLAACGGQPVPSASPVAESTASNPTRDPVVLTAQPSIGLLTNGELEAIDKLEIEVLDNQPQQVNITVSGVLEDSCTTLSTINAVRENDTTFRIHVYISRLANQMCVQNGTTFGTTLALDTAGLHAGDYTVVAYNQTATFTLATDNVIVTPAASACPQPTADEALQNDAGIGYCFLYPADFEHGTQAGHGTLTITGPRYSNGPEPLYAWLTVFTDYGASLDEYVNAKMSEASATGANVEKTELSLGGGRAVMLTGLPGQLAYREVLTVHNEAIYILQFWPDEPASDPRAQADMQRLFELVMRSWAWVNN